LAQFPKREDGREALVIGGLTQRTAWRIVAMLAIAVAFAGSAFLRWGQPGQAATLAGEAARTPADVSPTQPAAQGNNNPVIVIGMPGLRWSDVTRKGTPALWSLFERGSAAAMSVRTPHPQTCPIDGWLTLGAGARATAPHENGCTAMPTPRPETGGAARIPGFDRIAAANDDFSYDPRFGLLATAVTRRRGCLTAVGSGAGVAAADETGRVSRYVESTAGLNPGILTTCPVTLIDAGAVPDDPASRAAFLSRADRVVGQIAGAAPDGATIIVAGIADRGSAPHLGALIATGPRYRGGWLTADSTRHSGLVQLTDLTATVLSTAGIAVPDDAVGSVMSQTAGRPADQDVAWARLAQQDVAAQTIRDYAGIFFVLLELGQIQLYAVIAWLLWRSRERRAPRLRGNRLQRALRTGALFVASAPAASFLANLVPWWRAVHPAPVLGVAVLIGAIVLAALALLGPWRRWHLLGSAGFVAAVTTFVLAADVTVGGSRLQLSSLYGLSTLIAGRFYGFGNVAFAVFAMAAQFAALTIAALALDRGRRQAAIAAVAAIATAAVLVDGWPSWGADFGGVLAMVPGFALLGLAVAGKPLSVRRLATLIGAAAAAVVTIAVLDWLRGAGNRSHMGRFVQQIIDGEAGPVVERKLDAMVRSFTRGPEGIVIPLLLVLVGFLLAQPQRMPTLQRAFDHVPVLRPGLVAMLTTAVLGVLINDSGIQVAAVCLTVATPLVVAACAPLIRSPSETPERAQAAHVPR
jgi:hypothetical protein